ncbi:hypothetical protein ZOSMA_25G00760 [Zostera marina]|uniref:Uncharacterized protein n=1 Tax=Zostera marina TaxID=29655 RepID=A0A0K9PFF0_ZOSMR|nr:hypothetical protein ZOSMA_25G00760 [Zostera marina]
MEDNCGKDVEVEKNVEEVLQHENSDVSNVVNSLVEVKKDDVEIVVNSSVEESSIKIVDTINDASEQNIDAEATTEEVLTTIVENEDNVISNNSSKINNLDEGGLAKRTRSSLLHIYLNHWIEIDLQRVVTLGWKLKKLRGETSFPVSRFDVR